MHTNEETLDPGNWKGMEKLGLQMVEDMMQYLSTVRERKVWQAPPEEVKKIFQQPGSFRRRQHRKYLC